MAKYHLIFASSNYEGLKLMNEGMCKVYRDFYAKNRLITILPTGKRSDENIIKTEILQLLKGTPLSRKRIKEICMTKYFFRYKESEYHKVVKELLKNKKIYSDTGKTRINDNNLLALSK